MPNNFSRRQMIKTTGGFVAGAASVGGVPLISNLIAGSTLIEPAHAQALPPDYCDGFARYRLPTTTPSGTPLRLFCKGTGRGDYRFLNGVTRGGDVNLVLNSQYYSGTAWGVDEYRDSFTQRYFYKIKCRGNDQGSGTVSWLNGITANGEVNLVGDRDINLSGTKWAAYRKYYPDRNVVEWKFYCLGDGPGAKRWLNGITYLRPNQNNVDLTDSCLPPNTGTSWRRQ